jgi:hypothetical protein
MHSLPCSGADPLLCSRGSTGTIRPVYVKKWIGYSRTDPKGMLEFCLHGRWNQNSSVELLEDVDLPDQNEVVDRRCVCYSSEER